MILLTPSNLQPTTAWPSQFMREQASQQLDCLMQIPTPSLIQRTWATVIGLIKRHEATRVQIDKLNRTMLLLSTTVTSKHEHANNL